MNPFESGYPHVQLFEKGPHEPGLYKNQIGAVGAAFAHFSTRSEAALITMPTGTGKTAIMVLLSYIFRCKKVLVVTPSQLVRKQIAEQFRNPKLLTRNNILSKDHVPKVHELVSEEVNLENWLKILAEHDVCVAIPQTLNKVLDAGAIKVDAFDMVFVDEAHHSRAPSWTNILVYFNKAKQILLTATPFRRDKKDIKARLIYEYSLKQAYEEGLFSKVNFIPVKRELNVTDEEINILIAKEAESIYKKRAVATHKIIIRTDTKSKADELGHIYKEYTKLKLAVIHSKLGDKAIDERIGQLKNGEIDGIICVDMMGEGYDFPALKIAVIHVPHKSLAITLQFIGRISRTNIEGGNTATVIASEHDFALESVQLYKEDANWSLILPDLHRAKINQTADEQSFGDTFKTVSDDDEEIIPDANPVKLELDNFLPFFHVKLYRVFPKSGKGHRKITGETPVKLIDIFKAIDFTNTGILVSPVVRNQTVSEAEQVCIYVVSELIKPAWLVDNSTVRDITNSLIVIYFNLDNSILFICSTIKETELYEHIASSLIEPDTLYEIVYIPQLKRVTAGWENVKIYNVGMKSRKTRGNGESYRQILGSSAEEGISPADSFSYTRGHSFGGAYDSVLKKEVLLGISTSSKAWSLDEKKVIYLVKWCNDIARKVGDPDMDKLKFPLSNLDTGKLVETFPPDHPIFFADWDAHMYSKNTAVAFVDEEGTIVEEALLCSCTVEATNANKDETILTIKKNKSVAKIIFSISPVINYEYTADTSYRLVVNHGLYISKPEYILSLLKEHPIHLFYEDMSHLSGKVYFAFTQTIATFSHANFLKTTWPSHVNVHQEAITEEDLTNRKTGKTVPLSIHEYIIELASKDAEAVFYDHASLEIADVISFSKGKVCFYHCKKQDGETPRCTVEDMYEVIGQATKSVNWANRKFMINQLITRADKNKSASKIKKGSLALIKTILESFANPVIPVEIIIVQPGLKRDNHVASQKDAFQRISILLSGAEEYLKSVSQCELKVMCS